MRVWTFDTTAEAYDASQCDESIRSGDILIARDESVVGFLDRAWPVAVTLARGEFHAKLETTNWSHFGDGEYVESIKRAIAIALESGWDF